MAHYFDEDPDIDGLWQRIKDHFRNQWHWYALGGLVLFVIAVVL